MEKINLELVNLFLSDEEFWNNLEVVLETIATKFPQKLAYLNVKITSQTLYSLDKEKWNKQFALSQLFMRKSSTLDNDFFFYFYTVKELYPNPSMILSDCKANQNSFRRFIKSYQSQILNIKDWRKSYDVDNWLGKLDSWLESEEGRKFLNA